MNNIALVTLDDALNKAITLLFQEHYHIFKIELSEDFGFASKEKPVDVLIIDLQSLDWENLKLITLLKKVYDNLLIILLYDLKAPDNLRNELFQIADIMFRKPFNNQLLINAVSDFLNSKNKNEN